MGRVTFSVSVTIGLRDLDAGSVTSLSEAHIHSHWQARVLLTKICYQESIPRLLLDHSRFNSINLCQGC